MYRTIIERSLHSAMLPYLAFAAAYREHSVAAAARAHLDGLIALDPAAQKLVPLITHALTHERGTILEPFCCPEPLRAPLAAAMALLARGRFPKDAAHRSTLLVNQCTGSAWTGIECDAAGARSFRVRDFCTRVKAVQPPVRAGGLPYEPAIPLAFDLDRAARSHHAQLSHTLRWTMSIHRSPSCLKQRACCTAERIVELAMARGQVANWRSRILAFLCSTLQPRASITPPERGPSLKRRCFG